MDEPMVVENKRQKKLPPPRPPPPYKSPTREDAPVPIARSQTVSSDRPTRKPKLPTLNAGIRTGTPPLERKSAGDPVPPPRRKKQRSPGVHPGSGPTSPVKEAFGPDKQYPSQSVQTEDLKGKELSNQRANVPHRTVNTEPQDTQGKNEKENDQRARLPTRGVRSSKRKEAQEVAKAKGILVQDIDSGAECLKCKEKCEGFSLHVWRNVCFNCGCPRSDHKIPGASRVDIPYLSHLKFGEVTGERSSPAVNQLEWYPPNLSDEQVVLYMSHLPTECVPKRGSQGATHRHQQYLIQLCDSNKTMVTGLNEKETGRWTKFYDKMMKSASGVGEVAVLTTDKKKVCIGCFQLVEPGDVYVTAPDNVGEASAWHPQCFKCTKCQELLVDLVYFFSEQEQSIYCGRHQAELFFARCAACDQLIFEDTFTKAKGRPWHKNHFCCWECDEELHGKSYVEENNHICCTACFDELYANICCVCNKPISVGQPQITKGSRFWHGKCYRCTRCQKELVGKTVFTKGSEMVCETCASGGKTMACTGCKGRIQPTDKYLGNDGLFWHGDCFNCLLCGLSLVDTPFMKHEGNPLCTSCYDQQCSVRCTACDKAITSQGVKYKDKPYHHTCFLCASCDKQLAGVSFITHNDQPYCKQCHGAKFAKRCVVCNEGIVGKCTSFGEKNYHPKCFRCAQCNNVINSTSFYEDNHGKVLCEQCGNN